MKTRFRVSGLKIVNLDEYERVQERICELIKFTNTHLFLFKRKAGDNSPLKKIQRLNKIWDEILTDEIYGNDYHTMYFITDDGFASLLLYDGNKELAKFHVAFLDGEEDV
jgi:hypothetical protein